MNNENKETKLDVKPDEHHLLMGHEYDGIQELNHPLPSWWNVLFYVGIVYSTGYFIYYQFMNGPTLRDEFKDQHAKVLSVQAEFKRLNGLFKPEEYEAVVAADGVGKGKAVFEENCLSCHNENGKGDVGPNLTDNHWLIAKGTPETVYDVVYNGSEANGMPVWSELITKEQIYQAVSYVQSLKNTNQPGGKAPQGEKVVD